MIIAAVGISIAGCGASGTETLPPTGALDITPSSFTSGTYEGTYSDPDGDIFGMATSGDVTWTHTVAGGDQLYINPGYTSAISHLKITSNERQDRVDGTMDTPRSAQLILVFNSFVPGTYHGQSKSTQSHFSLDVSFTGQ